MSGQFLCCLLLLLLDGDDVEPRHKKQDAKCVRLSLSGLFRTKWIVVFELFVSILLGEQRLVTSFVRPNDDDKCITNYRV
uniref:Putative secreted protein n=1 Tax=Anopheles darlingi TaxID=43151 RepID=A0A2M4D5I4_ANODA